jgi:SAM-dependent methyltransferase
VSGLTVRDSPAESRTDSGGAEPAVLREDFDRLAVVDDGAWDHNRHYHGWLLAQVPTSARSVLEVGCGTGDFSRLLADRCQAVIGVDLSPGMIKVARERAAGLGNLRLEVADVMRHPLPPGSFDCVVSIATLHHLPLRAALQRLAGLVTPGGLLLLLDLYRAAGMADHMLALVAAPVSLGLGLARSGRLRPPPAVREAWAAHAKHDRYPTLAEVTSACGQALPGAVVTRHLLWRYSLTWRRPL